MLYIEKSNAFVTNTLHSITTAVPGVYPGLCKKINITIIS